jgi:hypothetical protein
MVCESTHVPLAGTLPQGFTAAWQLPLLHFWAPLQALHEAPPVPQAAVVFPAWQVLLEQHPSGQLDGPQLGATQ